jgi:hypothetical protein
MRDEGEGETLKIIDFFFAARPICLLPVWSVFLIVQKYVDGGKSSGLDAFLILAGLSLITAGAYFINQIGWVVVTGQKCQQQNRELAGE